MRLEVYFLDLLGWDPRASTLDLMVPKTGLVDAAAAMSPVPAPGAGAGAAAGAAAAAGAGAAAASAMSPVPAPGGPAAAAGTMAESKSLNDFLFGGWPYDMAEFALVVELAVVHTLVSPRCRWVGRIRGSSFDLKCQ